MAPMITAADSFVDPRLQTADQIVRIYRSLEVGPMPPQEIYIYLNAPFRNQLSSDSANRARLKMPKERYCSSTNPKFWCFPAVLIPFLRIRQ
jgi:hypothetical protein